MGKRSCSMVFHSFYCIKCGNKSYDLPRKKGIQKERFHRKKMFCPHCKIEINHIECRNDADVYEFKEMFEEGAFVEEAEESLSHTEGCLV